MPLLALLCFLAFDDTSDTLVRELKKLLDVFVTVDREAADEVDPAQVFFQGALPGMLRTLDPHSIFFDPGQFEQLKKMEASTQKGFGSVVLEQVMTEHFEAPPHIEFRLAGVTYELNGSFDALTTDHQATPVAGANRSV